MYGYVWCAYNACVCMCMGRVCIWRLVVDVECLPPLFAETGSLTKSRAHQFVASQLATGSSISTCQSLGLLTGYHIYMDTGDLNSNIHAYMASDLSTEPSLQPLNHGFLNNTLGVRFAVFYVVIKLNVGITKHLTTVKSS